MKTRSVMAAALTAALCWAVSAFGAPAPEDMAKAEAGDAAAQEKVGDVFYGEDNHAEAAAWYAKAAEQGRGKACYMLAVMYYYCGTGVVGNRDAAEMWYRKALDADIPQAEQGDADAMDRVASCYQNSHGVAEDRDTAKKWYLKALDAYLPKAEAGDADAMSMIAIYYQFGLGVEKDAARMQEWLREAFAIFKQRADDGDTAAYRRVGAAYALGNGVEKDLAEAARWYRRAAENGNAFSMSLMGQLHIEGEGVPQDYAAAAEWLQKAVEKGQPSAYYRLGTLYENGNGVPKDIGKAMSLYHAGAAKNEYYAKSRLQKLSDARDDGGRPEEMQGDVSRAGNPRPQPSPEVEGESLMASEIFRSVALALAFIGGMSLLAFAGRGVNWLLGKLGGKRRAARDAALDARVRSELAPGEELLWFDRWKSQPVGGLFFTLFGFMSFCLAALLLAFVFDGMISMLVICVFMICFGLFMMNLGTFAMLRQGRNYFFVTSRRLAFRGRSLMGLRVHKDVQPRQIREVALIDYRVYLAHIHYRVRVTFDDGNGETRRKEILPERDPECFAGAVKRIQGASSHSRR